MSMQSDVNSWFKLYVIASNNDIIPEGIAASTMETLYWRPTKPIEDAIKNATAGKNANFIIDVNAIIDLLREIPSKLMDNPNTIMINGIVPWPKYSIVFSKTDPIGMLKKLMPKPKIIAHKDGKNTIFFKAVFASPPNFKTRT